MFLMAVTCFFSVGPESCFAGGGPENVFLVVNQRSWASRTIANHYVSLRNIPSNNVFFIDWSGSVDRTDLATFRKKILQPIIAEIDKRRLGDQIDYVVYSSDFPYEIDFSKNVSSKDKFMSGSITSLTYLYELIEGNSADGIGRPNNFYANISAARGSSAGFRNGDSWSAMGKKSPEEEGTNYLLSAMLGYTSGRGNSVDEVVTYLTRAANADGQRPRGSVFYMTNQDIRTTTRSKLFPEYVRAIKAEGGNAEILEGTVPTGRNDVIGATIGRHVYNWADSGSQFLPGAIFDNLTSFGGVLREGAGQTPLTEALRHGAAGATGTVIEPYALRPKFPNPVVHLHYLRGCSLAESVYQSVTSPYQLLLVGDPLCQPYASIPRVTSDGIPSDGIVAGKVTIQPRVMALPGVQASRFELYVDGIRRGTCRTNGTMTFDSSTMADGAHEVRVVAVMNDKIRTQGRQITNITVANRKNTIRTRLTSPANVSLNGMISMDIEAPNAKRGIVLFNQRELMGNASGQRATVSFSPLRIGMGPHRLMAVGLGESNLDNVFAEPVNVNVKPGYLFPAKPMPVGTESQPGVQVVTAAGIPTSVATTRGNGWLTTAGVKKNEPFRLGSRFSVPQNGVYQFQIQVRGDVELKVDGKTLFAKKAITPYTRFEFPIHLQQGGHTLALNAKLDPPRMLLRFGDKGTQSLAGPTFQH